MEITTNHHFITESKPSPNYSNKAAKLKIRAINWSHGLSVHPQFKFINSLLNI